MPSGLGRLSWAKRRASASPTGSTRRRVSTWRTSSSPRRARSAGWTAHSSSRTPRTGTTLSSSSISLSAIPLLGRIRNRGLENPLLPLPAVLAVAVGFFVPLAVLVLYSFWPTENGRIIHHWTTANYVRFFTERAYWQMLLRSFWLVASA